MFRFYSSLRFRLMLIALLAVLPATLLILHESFEEHKYAATLAQEKTRRILELASMRHARMIEEAGQVVTALAESLPSNADSWEQCSDRFTERLKMRPPLPRRLSVFIL